MRYYATDEKYRGFRVYDAETGEELRGVYWFDDETWEYEQSVHFIAADGTICYLTDPERPGELQSEIKQGGIVVRRPPPDPTQEDAIKVTPSELVEYNLSYRPDDE